MSRLLPLSRSWRVLNAVSSSTKQHSSISDGISAFPLAAVLVVRGWSGSHRIWSCSAIVRGITTPRCFWWRHGCGCAG
ncbi:hypothetical protein BJ741DRAFT_634993 [Chytriomyces cf. hyalinus JEL632]|nr:hypothetical protein BJ741DRAFT_634993 [Chytriomyces cf. hyalinus JEL632]